MVHFLGRGPAPEHLGGSEIRFAPPPRRAPAVLTAPAADDGYYPFNDPPVTGLGAARMSALLTYRSRNSFESRFGRSTPDPARHPYSNTHSESRRSPETPSEEHWSIHTDGFKNMKKLATAEAPSFENGGLKRKPSSSSFTGPHRRPSHGSSEKAAHFFSAQSYLRYQGDKFVKRFDANCYIAITRKLDTHDVSRGRVPGNDVHAALALIQQPTLVIGIESDGLFTYAEQQELAECISNARLATIDSPEGHDAFLLQFEEVNSHILGFLKEILPDIMAKPGCELASVVEEEEENVGLSVGEVDDITAW